MASVRFSSPACGAARTISVSSHACEGLSLVAALHREVRDEIQHPRVLLLHDFGDGWQIGSGLVEHVGRQQQAGCGQAPFRIFAAQPLGAGPQPLERGPRNAETCLTLLGQGVDDPKSALSKTLRVGRASWPVEMGRWPTSRGFRPCLPDE